MSQSARLMFSSTRLREVMDEQGRRSEWLSRETGYDAVSVSRFLTGARPITAKFAILATRALDIPLDRIEESDDASAELVTR